MNAVSMHAFRRRALLPFRLAFTAFAFALFGLGGIVFGFFLTPWLKMAGGTPEEKKSLARRVVKRWFGLFVSVVTSLGLVRIEVKNPEAFQKKRSDSRGQPPITDRHCVPFIHRSRSNHYCQSIAPQELVYASPHFGSRLHPQRRRSRSTRSSGSRTFPRRLVRDFS